MFIKKDSPIGQNIDLSFKFFERPIISSQREVVILFSINTGAIFANLAKPKVKRSFPPGSVKNVNLCFYLFIFPEGEKLLFSSIQ
jgi:hypothetical protein